MTLRTSELGFTLIKAFESCKLKAYKCPAGIWTVGYGHTSEAGGLQVTSRTTITKKQAEELIIQDVDTFEDQVEVLVAGIQLEVHQFDALVSFAFNVGITALKTSTLLKKVKRGEHDAAAREFLKWDKARVNGVLTRLPGLTRRRNAEASLYRGDLHVAETYIGVDFGEMPQAVEAPLPPKTMAESKTGNASIIGGATGTVAVGSAMMDQIQETITPVQDLADQAQSVSGQAHQLTESASGAVTKVQGLAAVVPEKHLDLLMLIGQLAPWIIMLLIIVAAFSYIYYDRRKKLHEEGV